MVADQCIFKRYELKYLLNPEQKAAVLAAIAPYMSLDQYGRSTVRNLYFDTKDYRLIRRSMDKPLYKEKLRIRSYRRIEPHGKVFAELKKKYKGVVYKRRLALDEEQAMGWLCGKLPGPEDSQIAREIRYFCSFYGHLQPTVFLSYERCAYYCNDGSDFRVTFDENILCRREGLSLREDVWGTPILPEGMTLMEIKSNGAIPLYLVRILTEHRIYKTSFSKYGKAYEMLIFPQQKGDALYA